MEDTTSIGKSQVKISYVMLSKEEFSEYFNNPEGFEDMVEPILMVLVLNDKDEHVLPPIYADQKIAYGHALNYLLDVQKKALKNMVEEEGNTVIDYTSEPNIPKVA